MVKAIKYNLSHLLDFNGREARPMFWYYVLFLIILQFLAGMAITLPALFASLGDAMQAAQAGASEQELQVSMMKSMGGTLGAAVWISAGMSAAMALLVLAAFVRRLHDSGRTGWWALLALAGQALGIIISIRNIGAVQHLVALSTDPANVAQVAQIQTEMARTSLIGWIAPIVVIVFGVMASTPGANRYGEPEVTV
ncbi:MAG: DUF805 domain-containing protein [Croceibacterium sp.]